MRSTAEKRVDAAGLSRIMLAIQRPPLHRPAGTREALPGAIAGLAPRVLRLNLEKRVEDYAKIQRKDLKPVGQHLLD
jgi:hypothetical protein